MKLEFQWDKIRLEIPGNTTYGNYEIELQVLAKGANAINQEYPQATAQLRKFEARTLGHALIELADKLDIEDEQKEYYNRVQEEKRLKEETNGRNK